MIVFQIIGGVALILFGVRFLRKGLDRLFGRHLQEWIERMTSHRLKALGAGIVAGAIAPSSTALSVMFVQMLNASQLSAARTLSVMLGANIGITVLVQLVSFSITGFAPVCLVLGVLGFQILERNLFRGIGQCLLALGLIFLSMQMIGDAVRLLNPAGDLAAFMQLLNGHPWLVLMASAVVSFALQSSTATIALGIGFSASAHVGMALLIPWVLGTNIGICFTSLAAGWSALEGRRLAVSNLLLKGLAAALILLFLQPWILPALAVAGASDARQSANFHSLFNIAVALIALPLVTPLTRFVEKLILPPAIASELPLTGPESFLDLKAVDTPAFALAQATRELLAMGDEVKSMLQTWWRAFQAGDEQLARLAAEQDHRVDATYHALKKYLTLISEHELPARDRHWHLTLLTFSNELEDVGDIIATDLCNLVLKQTAYKIPLTATDHTDLGELYHKLVARYDIALSLLTTRDFALARSFISGKEALGQWCRERQVQHYERLRTGDDTALRSSAIFLEMLNDLRRINSHISAIGYAFQTTARRPRRPHSPADAVPGLEVGESLPDDD